MNITVIVHPNAKQPRLERGGGALHIYVSASPIEGKANAAVIKALCEEFGVSQSQVKLIRGAKSKQKVFEIG